MTDRDSRTACDLCGEPIADRKWLLLNRYAIGTGYGRSLIECQVDGECLWDCGTEGVSDDVVSGSLLCWPGCAHQWIEAQMVGSAVELRRQFGAG